LTFPFDGEGFLLILIRKKNSNSSYSPLEGERRERGFRG